MKIVFTAGDAVLKVGVTLRYLGMLSLMERCGLRTSVARVVPINVGKESDVIPKRELLEAVNTLLAWIGGDVGRSCAIDITFPGQAAFRGEGLSGIIVAGQRCEIDCMGPVCKLVADDLKNPATELPDKAPGDVVRCDDGVTITVIPSKGRSPFARFLIKIRTFAAAAAVDAIRVEVQ